MLFNVYRMVADEIANLEPNHRKFAEDEVSHAAAAEVLHCNRIHTEIQPQGIPIAGYRLKTPPRALEWP